MITVDDLTDEMVQALRDRADEFIEWPNKPRLRLGWYIFDALHAHNEYSRSLGREVCCHAINAAARSEK